MFLWYFLSSNFIKYGIFLGLQWLLERYVKTNPIKTILESERRKHLLFTFLCISQILAILFYFLIAGEVVKFAAVFSFGLSLLFIGFPLYSLFLFFRQKVPKNRIVQVIVGGQTLEWLLLIAFENTAGLTPFSRQHYLLYFFS